MKIILPRNIANIIEIINNSGFKAHIVGGCVRDIIIGKVPTDWDITTNASPQVIKSLFPKTVDTGIRHGTVTVIQDGISIEVPPGAKNPVTVTTGIPTAFARQTHWRMIYPAGTSP